MKVIAKIDAGVPARDWIKPIDGRENKEIWPSLPNGVLMHGGPLILKGRLYDIPDDKIESLSEIFEPVKQAKSKDGK